ncbi:MAG: UDP-N-acetyl-alpha-D-glucosamine C6 dehydratase [Bacteroidetes bacterium ADurb.Bin408]|nr:MAG: UDP-N-acetyl-alpha-D-glucosamine C6 dehydratase [Bacteroidetes bacterium ADurb.Bin408]
MFYKIFFDRQMPKWLIWFIDLILCFFTLILAYLLRFNFVLPERETILLPYIIPYVLCIKGIVFLIMGTNAGIIRYTSTRDALRVMIAVLISGIIFSIVNLVLFYFFDRKFLIPFSIVIIDFITCTFALTVFRIIVKMTYLELNNPSSKKTNVIIFGAGEGGVIAKRAIDRDAGTKYKVLAFLDEDIMKIGKKIEDVPIYALKELESLLKTNTVAHLILSIQNLKPEKKKAIIETCLSYNTKVLNVPKVGNWINGELSFKQIKKVNIEDLLERDPIKLDEKRIKKDLLDKVVLVSGAAGSIGSEISRQLTGFMPKKLILLDQAESPLFYLETELNSKLKHCPFEVIIGDIRDNAKMEDIFQKYKPDYIYHAAAYKHVPMMESNPEEAVSTNIRGTLLLANLAVKYKVSKFVMVSTDKAVNPTSVMGASKRIAEIYVQALNQKSTTKFITTRFGNVLGSNGSVVTLFKQQIEKGGPITITHPDVTRYFMTIPEACQLVLEAGAMGNGGEIYIFDMGHSVKIIDLAKKMIKLSGLTLGKDIQIVTTGLRPGEKLYEELLNSEENTLPTHHPQIMIAKVRTYDFDTISHEIEALVRESAQNDKMNIVRKMKQIVPEYKSNNSVFEQLDYN